MIKKLAFFTKQLKGLLYIVKVSKHIVTFFWIVAHQINIIALQSFQVPKTVSF